MSSLRWQFLLWVVAILTAVAWSYWPLLDAGFVWVDNILFQNAAWLRYGDSWKDRVFHNFYDWINYFRPLAVGLWVAQARLFDAAPQPMHAVSLALHLANTLLVGLLGLRLTTAREGAAIRAAAVCTAMLLYGVHAASIEPVAWISSQAEMLATLFMLLGLLLNSSLRRPVARGAGVVVCFFLAACAKESAAAFPLLLLLFDFAHDDHDGGLGTRARAIWARQWPVYVCVFAAGLAYLALRYWGLGFLLQPSSAQPLPFFSRLQTVGYLFVTYWRIILWPMYELGPLHLVDARQFDAFHWKLLGVDLAALAIVATASYLTWKRKPLGFLILATSAALLPVLHVIPVAFDASLYHERYAMTAIAVACALLPRTLLSINLRAVRLRPWLAIASTLIAAWLVLGVVNIRVTLPLWTDEIKLWTWVLQRYPTYDLAQSHLLTAYGQAGDRVHAREIADLLLAKQPHCADCMLNVAALAVEDVDVPRLKAALENARQTLGDAPNKRAWQAYLIAVGQLHELQGEAQQAVSAYQDAIRVEPLDPMARMDLALLQARQGYPVEARKNMDMAITLFAPEQRVRRLQEFEHVLETSQIASPAQP
jgi:tetratricopeptide (TPR) repeat protein